MTKFEQLYLNIINEYANTPNNQYMILSEDIKKCYPIKSTFLDLHMIINETIKTPELTPVPDEVLIECYKNIKMINNSCYKISYKQINDIINNSEYLLSETFSKCLNKYAKDITGNLYIFKSNLPDFEDFINNELTEIDTFKRINNIIQDEERTLQFISTILNNPNDGLTIIKHDLDIDKYKDCFIFINNVSNFKDVLEHEFTHFIQRICNFDPNLPQVYDHTLKLPILTGFISAIDFVLNKFNNKNNIKKYKYQLYNFLIDKLKQTEQHQTIKSMIKFFIRQYETDNKKYLINHKYLTVNQIENLDNKNLIQKHRLTWIINFLNSFNTFKNLEQYLENKIDQTHNVKTELFYLIYLAVKNEYNEYDIEKILMDEFKTFKFKDF